MKKLMVVLLAVTVLFSLSGCSKFGVNDNPPMQIPVFVDQLV